MRSLNATDLAKEGNDMILLSLRDQLVKEAKGRARNSKGKGKDDAQHASKESDTEANEREVQKKEIMPSIDIRQGLDSVLAVLATAVTLSIAHDQLVGYVLALEVLGFLLVAAAHRVEEAEVIELLSPALLDQLTTLVYSTLDSGPPALLTKGRKALADLIDLGTALRSSQLTASLLERITLAPWVSKRTISIFEALLKPLKVVDLVAAFGETANGSIGLLTKILDGMGESDEVAVLMGRVANKLIIKEWSEGGAKDFWIEPVTRILRQSSRGRPSVSQYVLTPLFQQNKSAFKELLSKGKFMVLDNERNALVDGQGGRVGDLEGVLSILKIGNTLGLIEGNGDTKLDDNKIRLPATLLSQCLSHSSSSLSCSALSLLVITSTPSLRLPSSAFDLLKAFYLNSTGDENGEFRMRSLSLSGTLLLRLRDSSWKAEKKGDVVYVDEVKSFLAWWFDDLIFRLNPASPFRVRINTLRLVDLILQTGLDATLLPLPEKSSNGYSSYRQIPKTAVPLASVLHSNVHGWNFSLDLINARATFTLLRLLKSTYTALRALATSLLERFPSPLPGYEHGRLGDEKVRSELLEPALEMMKSGRESQASAGAVILGLVYRKWVLEGESQWDLGDVGGWSKLEGATQRTIGPPVFSFLNAVMDLAEYQLAVHATDLARAAQTQPMHGTLLTLRHLFTSIPLSSTAATIDERRTIFLRALRIVERVWEVTSVVLAASAPESVVAGEIATAGNEEERALGVIEDRDLDGEGDGGDDEGSGGPIHKIILSATWRAMKEAGELLETILRLPAELDVESFKSVWTFAEIQHIGQLYSTWLSKVRHRGCMMAIHPTYSRSASTLLSCKGWPEVQKLPIEWLDGLLASITSQKISTTRRSAGIPFSILAIFTAILPSDRPTFERAFNQLFEISESKSSDISDESRVHAMNTLRTVFLDGKASAAVAPYIERAFKLSIGMFWSPRWICRNVAMILYSALVNRSFGTRRLNLDRNNASLVQRLPLDDFFSRYPSLHAILLSELEFCTREHLDDLPTIDLNSSLFSILMLVSLMQTTNRVTEGMTNISDTFVSVVRGCAPSRVWKIRDAAADALTGLIPSSEVSSVCLDILNGLEKCVENELHGRLVQCLRLLEAAGELSPDGESKIAARIEALASPLLDDRRSFSVRTTFMHLARVFAVATLRLSARLYKTAHQILEASRTWPTATTHLPSAENFVTACYLLVLLYDPSSTTLLIAGLASPFLSIQKETLDFLESTSAGGSVSEEIAPALIDLALSHTDSQECRIQAITLLASSDMLITNAEEDDTLISELISIHLLTVIVPISEVLLPWIAHLIAQEDTPQLDVLLEILDASSSVNQSIEMRECAARALLKLKNVVIVDPIKKDLYARLVLRLVQDDNPTVREFAAEIATSRWTGGESLTDRRGMEIILGEVGPSSWDQMSAEFKSDLEQLQSTSSLLFVVEPPNIYQNDLLETELVLASSASSSKFVDTPRQLASALESLRVLKEDLKKGPLGILGSDVLCKWAYRLVSRYDRLTAKEKKVVSQDRDLIDLLRLSC